MFESMRAVARTVLLYCIVAGIVLVAHCDVMSAFNGVPEPTSSIRQPQCARWSKCRLQPKCPIRLQPVIAQQRPLFEWIVRPERPLHRPPPTPSAPNVSPTASPAPALALPDFQKHKLE